MPGDWEFVKPSEGQDIRGRERKIQPERRENEIELKRKGLCQLVR